MRQVLIHARKTTDDKVRLDTKNVWSLITKATAKKVTQLIFPVSGESGMRGAKPRVAGSKHGSYRHRRCVGTEKQAGFRSQPLTS